jgi:hypothetical protein
MATTKKHLVQLRSNTNFTVNYENNNLTPQIELIILSYEPKYNLTKKGIVKEHEIGEFRIFANLEGINAMIGELQLLASQLQKFEQLSVGINLLIESAKEKTEDK